MKHLNFRLASLPLSLLLLSGMVLTFMIAYHPDLKSVSLLPSFFSLFIGYQHLMQYVFYFAIFLHLLEGSICFYQVSKFYENNQALVSRDNETWVKFLYVLQTLIFGFTSFHALHDEIDSLNLGQDKSK